MATVIETPKEQLDTETISEYIREPKAPKPQVQKSSQRSYSQDFLNSASEVISVAKAIKSAVVPAHTEQAFKVTQKLTDIKAAEIDDIIEPKADILETLWPGVHQDFAHTLHIKRMPSYYLMFGFMGGAVIALIGLWSFSTISSLFANYGKSPASLTQSKIGSTTVNANSLVGGVRVPLVSSYEVKEGDTLAGIVLHNYKHVSPRLIDEVCKVNNLTDANVLILGQKLVLPEYHY